jgi:exonuclease III
LRVVSWNSAKAFRNKSKKILELEPDIAVILECENPEFCKEKEWLQDFASYVWFGENKNQGVAVFAAKGIKIEALNWFDKNIKLIRPFKIKTENVEFVILPVWANNADSPTFRYIGQVWKFLEKYKSELNGLDVLMLGDFNSNAQWDIGDRWWNHSDIVNTLKNLSVESLYHLQGCVEQGQEVDKTFFMHKKLHKGYHIDYIFGSKLFQEKLAGFEIGGFDEWIQYSDHRPLICDFDIELESK